MSFGTSPKDNQNTPTSSVYVPGTANSDLTALRGMNSTTDSNNQKSAAASMGIEDGANISQGALADVAVTGDNPGSLSAKLRGLTKMFADVWDGTNHWLQVKVMNGNANGQNTMANSSPVAISSNQTPIPIFAEYAILNGVGYSATTGIVASGAALNAVPVSFFVPVTSTRNVYLYSVEFWVGQAINAQATLVTTDGNYATVLTALNNKVGGASSVSGANITTTNVATAVTGTKLSSEADVGNHTQNIFQNGSGLLLPAGVANGLVLWLNIGSATTYAATFKWREF